MKRPARATGRARTRRADLRNISSHAQSSANTHTLLKRTLKTQGKLLCPLRVGCGPWRPGIGSLCQSTHQAKPQGPRDFPCTRGTEPHHLALLVGKVLLELGGDTVASGLGITEQHSGVVLEEHGVLQVCVAAGHGPLHEYASPCLPHLNDRHPGNRAIRIGLGQFVGDIVSSHHQAHVLVRHIRVHLLHLLHPLVRGPGLRQQHVHLPGHPPSNRVDPEPHIDVVGAQGGCDVRDGVLRPGHGHAIPGDDHDVLGLREQSGGGLNVGLLVLEDDLLALLRRRSGVQATEDDVGDVSVHGVAHDLG
mmetsp:Transcript_28018/g.61771  ORF Transcript_28018/g.61771 Transcript_28018/m.61771 type:complete len:306 (-) Transcript_28018:1802-2719(-)